MSGSDNSSEVELTLSVRQFIAGAMTVGALVGSLGTSLAYSSGLVGSGAESAASRSISGSAGETASSAGGNTESRPIADTVSEVDSEAIAECMQRNRDQHLREIRDDRATARQLGINGTPGFIVTRTGSDTGERIVGAQPYSTFEEAIEAQLDGENRGQSVEALSTTDEPYIGSEDAPVTIAYWYDYQCRFCSRFEQRTLPQIQREYVQSGDVRIVFNDFAFLGEDSRTAAVAARCVWDRNGKSVFARWNRAVFENQESENSGWASKENLVG